jgi:glycerol-3-phosphate dehydrogenase
MLPLHYVNKDYGILIPKTEDGRVIFVLPYHEKALVGTTDKTWQNITNDPKAPKEDL